MAYLQCPFCPAQGVPDGSPITTHTPERELRENCGHAVTWFVLQPYRCNGGTHRFYVEKGELDGNTFVPES